jgi:hypothetical protein
MQKHILVLSTLLSLVANIALAQTSQHTAEDISGYKCMALAASYGPDGIHAMPAPVYAGPESNAKQVGSSGAVIITPDPIQPVNGRTAMIWANGRKVWIDVNLLTKWHSLGDPAAVCTPQILANGRYGFHTHD